VLDEECRGFFYCSLLRTNFTAESFLDKENWNTRKIKSKGWLLTVTFKVC
jgi:hypothetical protein